MKRIVNFFKNLPKGVKMLLYINIIVYIISLLFDLIFSIKLNQYLGVYSTNDERFNLYQIITSMFSHDLYSDHIYTNLLIFLIFAPSVENKLGYKNFMLLYFLSGIFGFILSDPFLCKNYNELIENYKLDLNLIKEFQYFNNMEFESKMSHNFGIGSSGCISGVLTGYLFLNLLNFRKIIYNLIILLLVISNIMVIRMGVGNLFTASCYNHVGGFTFGIIFSIYLYFIKDKLRTLFKI